MNIAFFAVAFAAAIATLSAQMPSASRPPVTFTKDGKLRQPDGYRRWVYAGTPITPNDMNAGKAAFPEFHAVYIDPSAYDHYAKTGQFPDGAVIVKELLSVGAKKATSGNGYFMGEFTGLEVAIKDSTRFRDEPGNWAFFSFGHKYPLQKQSAAQATTSCNACHGANAGDDFVFTQYYPVLRAAKASAGKR
ncbi:MAG: cytochrome P460 family protein [Bryobacteraceae bacterium]